MEDDEQFESADSGSSSTIPMPCNDVRKGGYIAMKGRPCRVVETSTSKTGKHGHAKMHIVAIDIFNGKKYEELVPTSHNVAVPEVERKDYSLLGIHEDGFLSLMGEDNTMREDLKMPTDTELADLIRRNEAESHASGKTVSLTIYKAMDIEQVMSTKLID